MAPVIIYGHNSVRVRTVRATCLYEGLDFELKMARDDPEFKKLFPLGKMPAIVDGDFQLTEAVPILAYLASKNHSPTATSSLLQTAKNAIGAGRPSLLGRDIKEEVQILQWCSFANQEYLPKLFPWFGSLNGLIGYNKKVVEEGKENTHKHLSYLDNHLKTRTYFVGETVTLADIFIADVTQSGCSFVFDKPLREKYPNLFRHYDTITHQDFYLPVTPEGKGPVYRDEAIKFQPPAKS